MYGIHIGVLGEFNEWNLRSGEKPNLNTFAQEGGRKRKQACTTAKCANRTFLKARQQLEEDKLIEKHDKTNPKGGLSYKMYFLTEKGTKELQDTSIRNAIQELSREDLEKFMKQSKIVVAEMIMQHLDDLAATGGFYGGANRETYSENNVSEIENDLRKAGFNEWEITKMWLTELGYPIIGFYEGKNKPPLSQ